MSGEFNQARDRAQPKPIATEKDAEQAQPREGGKPNFLRFGGGLFLKVTPRQKLWVCNVMRNGKQTTVDLGRFPEVRAKQAKRRRAEILTAVDPVAERHNRKVEADRAAAATFEAVAQRWLRAEAARREWSVQREQDVTARLAKHVLPRWGDRPVGSILPYEATDLVLALHRRRKAMAVAIKQYVVDIFDFAVEERHLAANPIMRRRLPRQARGTPRAAVGSIEEARRVLAVVERMTPSRRDPQPHSRLAPWTLLAHRLVALTAVRMSEAAGARWSEFDLAASAWVIPAERMKAGREHVVALAPQAIEIIRAAEAISDGSDFVFPSQRGKHQPMHRATCTTALAKVLAKAGMDGAQVMHGWRSAFSTIMNERDPSRGRVIEAMLAHKVGDLEGRYNRAQHLAARAPIACEWADLLLVGAPSARVLIGLDEVEATNVVPLRRAAA